MPVHLYYRVHREVFEAFVAPSSVHLTLASNFLELILHANQAYSQFLQLFLYTLKGRSSLEAIFFITDGQVRM